MNCFFLNRDKIFCSITLICCRMIFHNIDISHGTDFYRKL